MLANSHLCHTDFAPTRLYAAGHMFKVVIIEKDSFQIDVIQKTGLTDRQVRTIITRQMKVAPLDLAMQLSGRIGLKPSY